MAHMPTVHDLDQARHAFEENEPRDLFYRVAMELTSLALESRTSLTVAEALAVLLRTWNSAFYRYRRGLTHEHFAKLEELVLSHRSMLLAFRECSIEGFDQNHSSAVGQVFQDFESLLGPVGAAKCLHLLAPRFFPIWDRAIAEAYGLGLAAAGKNAANYCRFMDISKTQVLALGGEQAVGRNPLKAIDEYNYCKHTKRWIS